ncbi:MAG TPA: hypothetical protein VNT99_02020, partial [Methylomirabilota bacterium]|nr:hypothetical protein [Methylomirabilota bacterium]
KAILECRNIAVGSQRDFSPSRRKNNLEIRKSGMKRNCFLSSKSNCSPPESFLCAAARIRRAVVHNSFTNDSPRTDNFIAASGILRSMKMKMYHAAALAVRHAQAIGQEFRQRVRRSSVEAGPGSKQARRQ